MINYYVAIVSHGHEDYIFNNNDLLCINDLDNVHVVIKDNVANQGLKGYCEGVGYNYIDLPLGIGFGENNNEIFDYCLKNGMEEQDWFLIVNPDVNISIEYFSKLLLELDDESNKLLTINLFRDEKLTISENSLRYFPKWKGLMSMLRGKPVNTPYNKDIIEDRDEIDWASGAFLIFKSSLYKELNGFSYRYFMYFEDVDICYRARYQKNQPVIFLKNISAVHAGAYANRNVFSKHFRWYLVSLFKFLLGK